MIRLASALSLAALLALTTGAAPVHANSIEVQRDARLDGQYGLRIVLDTPGCTSSGTLVVPPGSISGPQEFASCDDLHAADVVVTGSGDLRLSAAGTVALGDGFRVAQGGRLAISSNPALGGDLYVEQDLPVLRDRVAVRFRLDVDQVNFGADAEVDLLTGLAPDGRTAFAVSVWFRPSLGQARLFVRAITNTGAPLDSRSSSVLLSTGSHAVDVVWTAGDVGSGNGSVGLWLDGVSRPGITGIGNHSLDVETLRFGALGVEVAATGRLNLDSFVAQSEGPVGPVQ